MTFQSLTEQRFLEKQEQRTELTRYNSEER